MSTRLPGRFTADIPTRHDRGVHREEIQFGHIFMQAGNRVVVQAPAVGIVERHQRAKGFGLVFLKRHQHAPAQCLAHLHGGETGSRAVAGGHLHLNPANPGHFDGRIQVETAGHGGVAGIDMPAAKEQGLGGPVVHLPVAVISEFILDQGLAIRIPVGVEFDVVFFCDARQQGK